MKKVITVFGRMNPPTSGHQKLVDKVNSLAKGADARIYLSHSQNNKKDPLDYNTKIALAQKAFGSAVTKSNAKTIIQVMQELQKLGYTDVVLVAGSDRVASFEKLLNQYNGKDYTFDSIKVVSAGQRDPDADDVSGMSASKLRALAKEGNFAAFKTGLPKKLQSSAKKIYDQLRSILEQLETEQQLDEFVLNLQQRQKRARLMRRLAKRMARQKKIRAKRMADTNRLHKRAMKVAKNIIRKKVAGERGAHYRELSSAEKMSIDKVVEKKSAVIAKLAKRLMPKVRKAEIARVAAARGQTKNETIEYQADEMLAEMFYAEAIELIEAQDPEIKDREGAQPAKYHSGLSKSTKVKRDQQFKKGAEKDSDDPSAYPDKHAGDTLETKPSKYTKKYHQMFGKTYEISEDSESALKKKAEKSGISYGILKKVYDRGMAAWRTGHRPGATQQQWAYARVNSFITGGKTRSTSDADLWRQHKGKAESYKLSEVQEMLRHEGSKWVLYSKDGSKKLGEFDTKEDALERERQIQYFKHAKEEIKKPKTFSKMLKKPSDREEGTDSLVKTYKKDTPKQAIKEAIEYHRINSLCIKENIFRPHSDAYYKFFCEARRLWEAGKLEINDPFDVMLLESDAGLLAIYEGQEVPLDIPLVEEEDVELNKPKRGGSKKFYVYVKDPSTGNVKKVSFGDTTGLKVKIDSPEARKSFVARHDCANKKDKTTPGYWACRLPYYAKELGLSGGGSFFW